MSARTSQLQIRVTPGEKETLKRLARAAGRSVSAYVLSQALPSVNRELAAAVDEVASAEGKLASTGRLWTLLRGHSPDELVSPAADPRLSDQSRLTQNLAAALAEEAAWEKGVDPPAWAQAVRPLERPHFGWALESLKPHQLRVTPPPFKRRNIFFDPATRPGGEQAHATRPVVPEEAREAVRRLAVLGRDLARPKLDVEFYFTSGAVVYQAFRAHPSTARVSELLAPSAQVEEVATHVAVREGWPLDWLAATVKSYLTGREGRYIELPGVRALAPPIEFVLAVKVAALRLGPEPRLMDDIRYLLRAGNVANADAANSLVTRYFAQRQLSPDTTEILSDLLGR